MGNVNKKKSLIPDVLPQHNVICSDARDEINEIANTAKLDYGISCKIEKSVLCRLKDHYM